MTPEQEESLLQGLLASAGFIDSAIKRLAEGKEQATIKYMSNALIILNRFIKSIRGF